MAYYVINGTPVFLSRSLLARLEDIVLKEWDPLDRIGARVRGSKAEEASALIYEFLAEKAKSSQFHQDYVTFDLTYNDAETNVTDLLFDYCHLHGIGRLIDNQSFDDKLIADHQGHAHIYPAGKNFEIHFPISANHKVPFWKPWNKPVPTAVRMRICVSEIDRLHGNLNEFTLRMRSQSIKFDKYGIVF